MEGYLRGVFRYAFNRYALQDDLLTSSVLPDAAVNLATIEER
jgi:hypothetical protein